MTYPLPEQAPAFEKVAKHAVGASLLFRRSRNGGSHGPGLDEQRAAKIANDGIDPDSLYELLLDVARRATEEAAEELRRAERRLLDGTSAVAEQSDSLTLHRFVERLTAEVRQREEQRRATAGAEVGA